MAASELLPATVHFGAGALARIGDLARGLGMRHALIVSDRGIVAAGYVDVARRALDAVGTASDTFHEFSENPDTEMVEAGRSAAAAFGIDGLIGLGGGSSMDCAKAINFVLTSGGSMVDYRGYGKASRPMLSMIGVPTTAGTGSEAQTYAVISDARTHVKMACGDPKAAFAAVILDPVLTVTQPAHVTAAAGYDAISHAVETWVTLKRNEASDEFAREAWKLLSGAYERVLAVPGDIEARGAMLLGAYYAGAAIERSMLGATHACANPLTAHYGTTHGVAIAMLLKHVVRWNSENRRATTRRATSSATTRTAATRNEAPGATTRTAATRSATTSSPAEASAEAGVVAISTRYAELASDLEARLVMMASAGQFPVGLAAAGVSKHDLETLAGDAAEQWTGSFNPRPFDAAGAREIYERAW